MPTPYVQGVNTLQQARICTDRCDWPDRDCITHGNVYPFRRRCALERYLDDNYEPPPEIPENFLTVREFASRVGVSYETVRKRLRAGKYPGAKRVGRGQTAPWAIPADAIER